MSLRLASFMYEDVRYFVVLDGGFLQKEFPDKNAVDIQTIQVNAGYSAAVSQPWGAYRPMTCPVSDDAKVTKVGDRFIVHGTCGGVRFELTEYSYEIEEVKEESEEVHVTEETLEAAAELSEELPATEHPVVGEMTAEQIKNPVVKNMADTPTVHASVTKDSAEETELVYEDAAHAPSPSPKAEAVKRTALLIGRSTGGSFKRDASIQDNRPEPAAYIVDPVMREHDEYRGIRLGASVTQDDRSRPTDKPSMSNKTQVVGKPSRDSRTTEPKSVKLCDQRVTIQETVEKKAEDTEEEKQLDAKLSFDDAPKPSAHDFDANKFLSELSPEQVSFLKRVPKELLGSINEFTQKPVSSAKLESLGAVYCVENRWKIQGDWYAIDEVQSLSRVLYCATTNEFQRIFTKTLKGWMKCMEAGLLA